MKSSTAVAQGTKPVKKSASAAKSTSSHPPYIQMITDALVALKERTGSSHYAIAKHIEEEQKFKDLPSNFKKLLFVQLKKFVASGKLVMVKKSFKLPPKTTATATATAAAKPAAVAKPKAKVTAEKKEKKPAAKPKAATAAAKVAKSSLKVVKSPMKKKAAAKPVKAKKPKSLKSPVKKAAPKTTKAAAAPKAAAAAKKGKK